MAFSGLEAARSLVRDLRDLNALLNKVVSDLETSKEELTNSVRIQKGLNLCLRPIQISFDKSMIDDVSEPRI